MLRKFLILFLSLVGAGCATYAATSGRIVVRDDRAGTELRFSDRDRATIEEYFHAHPTHKAPPGAAKGEPIPARLARRDVLAPGLQGRLLPRELESRLGALPAPYVRLIVGTDLILLERHTRVVQDIVLGVAR